MVPTGNYPRGKCGESMCRTCGQGAAFNLDRTKFVPTGQARQRPATFMRSMSTDPMDLEPIL